MKIVAKDLIKDYGQQRALDRFNLEANDFQCLAFIGPSGGGKSTALRHLCGLETPNDGYIEINDQRLSNKPDALIQFRKTIGIVFQSYNLFPHLTALQNITLPLTEVHKMNKTEAEHRALEILERFALKEHAYKKPIELSGGQSQRVAITRALAPDPQILFFDEPTSALDPEMTAEVLEVIENLISERKKVVLVTHEMGFARKAADQVAFISDGKVTEHAHSEAIFSDPQSPITRRFLSKVLKY